MEAQVFEVRTIRYRYEREWNGRVPTYTEWQLYRNNELVSTKRTGRFQNVNQFLKWAKTRFEIEGDVKKLPAEIHYLQFKAQRA